MIDGRTRIAGVLVVVGSLTALAAVAQVGPLAVEFQVNAYTSGTQDDVAIASDGDGDFIVVWSSDGQDANGKGPFARRFTSAGLPAGIEFQVHAYTTGNQVSPAVSADPDGDFVIAWASVQDGNSFGVFARRYSSAGVLLAVEFQVNTYTSGVQNNMAIAHHANGDFVIAWEDNGRDGNNYGVFARSFDSAGVALASQFQVNSYTSNIQNRPSVATAPGGGFVIAWSSLNQDGSIGGVFARRFSSAGALATEFQVNTYTTGGQLQASVAVDTEGDFVIAWNGPETGSGVNGVFAQRFSSAGDFLGGEFLVNAYTTGSQTRIQIAMEPDGDFVAVWTSDSNLDGFGNGIFSRAFSSAGDPLASEFQVNTYTTYLQTIPSVAMDAEGEFVVVWQSQYQDGGVYAGYGIFARRYGVATANLDIDGNGAPEPLTDGLLILRDLFGFTGNTLVANAVGNGCTNCTAEQIQAAIDALGLVIDVDGNNDLQALTDGLLVLRYLFGFTGTALTGNAIGGGCSRCDATAIEPYLANYVN